MTTTRVRSVLEALGVVALGILLTAIAFAIFLFSCAVFGACEL